MDKLRNDFLSALREAIQRTGAQTELAKASGMQQSRISDYLSERYELENIAALLLFIAAFCFHKAAAKNELK